MWKHRKNKDDRSNPDFDYEAWKKKHMAFADEAVPKWVKEVKEKYGQPETKYACVGSVVRFLLVKLYINVVSGTALVLHMSAMSLRLARSQLVLLDIPHFSKSIISSISKVSFSHRQCSNR